MRRNMTLFGKFSRTLPGCSRFEPLTDADKQAIKEADENFAAGRFVTHEDLKKELGL